jgi:hypothetical protein
MPRKIRIIFDKRKNPSIYHKRFFPEKRVSKNSIFAITALSYFFLFLCFIPRQRGNALANNNIPAIMLFAVLSLCRRNRCLTEKQAISF